MPTATTSRATRSSQRIPLVVQVTITSLDLEHEFAEPCDTMVVNSQGCAVRSPKPLEPGTPVLLENMRTRHTTTAHVVGCKPMGDSKSWHLGIALDKEEDFWGVSLGDELPSKNGEPAQSKNLEQPAGEISGHAAAPKVPAHERSSQPTAAGSSLAAAAVPAPTASSPTVAGTRTAAEDALRRFEQGLREKLKSISEQFEQDCRQKVSEFVAQMHSDVEGHTNAEIERLHSKAEEQAASIASALTKKSAEDIRRWRDQVAAAQADALSQLDEQLRSQSTAVMRRIEEEKKQAATATAEYTKLVHESLLEASDQIKGRLRVAVEMAQEPIESCGFEVLARVEETIKTKMQDMTQQIDSACTRMETLRTGIESSAEESIKSRIATALQEFQQDEETIKTKMQDMMQQIDSACTRMETLRTGIESSAEESIKSRIATALQEFQHATDKRTQDALAHLNHGLAETLQFMSGALRDNSKSGS